MLDEDLNYAVARMAKAVRILCDDESDVKGRLYSAAPSIGFAWAALARIPQHVLPAEVRVQMDSILDRLTKRASYRAPMPYYARNIGTVAATLEGMHKKTASRIARDVRRTHDMLEHTQRLRAAGRGAPQP